MLIENSTDELLPSALPFANIVLVAVDFVPTTKICSKCKEEKALNCFSKDTRNRSGLRSNCKSCCFITTNEWRKNNVEKIKSDFSKWYKDNTQKIKIKSKTYYENNTEKLKVASLEWRKNNLEKAKDRSNKWKKNNPEKSKFHCAKFRKKYTQCISDGYVKHILVKNGFSNLDVINTPELIEIKRLLIKTKRLCKTSQN